MVRRLNALRACRIAYAMQQAFGLDISGWENATGPLDGLGRDKPGDAADEASCRLVPRIIRGKTQAQAREKDPQPAASAEPMAQIAPDRP